MACITGVAAGKAAEDDGGPGLGHLLLVKGLHQGRGGSPACLARPRQLQPATVMELSLPLPLERAVVVLAVAPDSAVPPLGREVEIEPGSDLGPECLLLRREAEIHVSEASKKWHIGAVSAELFCRRCA